MESSSTQLLQKMSRRSLGLKSIKGLWELQSSKVKPWGTLLAQATHKANANPQILTYSVQLSRKTDSTSSPEDNLIFPMATFETLSIKDPIKKKSWSKNSSKKPLRKGKLSYKLQWVTFTSNYLLMTLPKPVRILSNYPKKDFMTVWFSTESLRALCAKLDVQMETELGDSRFGVITLLISCVLTNTDSTNLTLLQWPTEDLAQMGVSFSSLLYHALGYKTNTQYSVEWSRESLQSSRLIS